MQELPPPWGHTTRAGYSLHIKGAYGLSAILSPEFPGLQPELGDRDAGARQEAGRVQRGEPVVPALEEDGVVLGFLGVGVKPDLQSLRRFGGFSLDCCQFFLPAEAENGVSGLGQQVVVGHVGQLGNHLPYSLGCEGGLTGVRQCGQAVDPWVRAAGQKLVSGLL